MANEKKSALAEFSRRALQRLQDKKIPKHRILHVPSMEMDITIRNLTTAEVAECVDMEEGRGDKYSIYLAVVEPDFRAAAKEIMNQEADLPMDQRQLKEALDIVDIFNASEQAEIATQIMELSGMMNAPKVTVVDALKN